MSGHGLLRPRTRLGGWWYRVVMKVAHRWGFCYPAPLAADPATEEENDG